MSKKSERPQTPRHILVFDEDWEVLEACFGPHGLKPVGISTVLRALIHQYVLNVREAQNNAVTAARRNTMEHSPNANSTPILGPEGSPPREHL